MRERQWNSERFIVFQTVILQQAGHVTASHAIRRRIGKRLDAWEDGKYGMLVEDILRTCEQYITFSCREELVEHRAQTYHSMVLRGKVRTVVRWITERETGGALQLGERCTKKGERVTEVLRTKNPDDRAPTASRMDS